MVFATLSQLKSRAWDSRADAETALKQSALAIETPTYRVSQSPAGKFYIEDIEPASKDVKLDAVVPLNTGKQTPALARIKAAGKGQCGNCGAILSKANKAAGTGLCDACAGRNITAGDTVPRTNGEVRQGIAAVAAKRVAKGKAAQAPVTAPPAAAAKTAAPAAKKAAGRPASPTKGGPDVAKLPAGFAAWAITEAQSKDGLMRVALKKKSGIECKWFGYLKGIAADKGLTATMERVGRLTLFRMAGAKGKAAEPPKAPEPARKAAGKKAAAPPVKAAAEAQVNPRFRKQAAKKTAKR